LALGGGLGTEEQVSVFGTGEVMLAARVRDKALSTLEIEFFFLRKDGSFLI
jgi:hypothetical protein